MAKITIENKSTVTLHGLPSGARLAIEADCNGIPLEKQWRRRLKDSAADGAIVVVTKSETKKEVKG